MKVGIDLGTTNSLISCYISGKPVLIPNSIGKYLTPSVVSIDEESIVYIGEIAKERLLSHPTQTASVFKRLMGSDKKIQLGKNQFSSIDLSALVIKSLIDDAKNYLGKEITEAIISVPAYFNDIQRTATINAAQIAGVKVERLINEPTAAAIAYGLHDQLIDKKFIVLDLGGGTFDVSLLEIFENIIEVHAASGDNHLGGEDFLDVIVDDFCKQNSISFNEQNVLDKCKIQNFCEQIKHKLSNEKEINENLTLSNSIFSYHINEDKFEELSGALLLRLVKPIEVVIRDSKTDINDLEDIILVGGATRMPIFRKQIVKIFSRFPRFDLDPDSVVALGAGIQAALKEKNKDFADVVLTDVAPYSLGVGVSMGELPSSNRESEYFSPIIERNTPIPVSFMREYYKTYEKQKKIEINIYQGESRLTQDNILIGSLTISAPEGRIEENPINVRFTYDVNGVLEVEVNIDSSGVYERLVIMNGSQKMSDEQIDARLTELSKLKIHPKDNDVNKYLIVLAEKLYQTSLGEERQQLMYYINTFIYSLDTQVIENINAAKNQLIAIMKLIDPDMPI